MGCKNAKIDFSMIGHWRRSEEMERILREFGGLISWQKPHTIDCISLTTLDGQARIAIHVEKHCWTHSYACDNYSIGWTKLDPKESCPKIGDLWPEGSAKKLSNFYFKKLPKFSNVVLIIKLKDVDTRLSLLWVISEVTTKKRKTFQILMQKKGHFTVRNKHKFSLTLNHS